MERDRNAGTVVPVVGGDAHWQAQAGCKGQCRSGREHRVVCAVTIAELTPRAQLGPSGRANLNGRMRNRMSALAGLNLLVEPMSAPPAARPTLAGPGRTAGFYYTAAVTGTVHPGPACNLK